jgi:cytochrome c553
MRRTASLGLAVALAGLLLAVGVVFAVTDAQVARGAAVFEQSCATCHGSSGNDGFATPLMGPGTLVRFASTRELYDYTSVTMPLAAEGSLTERQYLDVIAWMLAQRGRASGTVDLSLATLDSTPLHGGAAAAPTAAPSPVATPTAAPAPAVPPTSTPSPAAPPAATPAPEQWPTTCVDLNDIVEAHLGNDGNVGIYQRVFGDQAEQGCQNDHRDDVRAVFSWAFDQTAPSADAGTQDLAWPTDCVDLNDIVENHLGNDGNVEIYQRTFGDQAETACRNDHREDVRGVFGWAFDGATSSAAGLPLSTDEIAAPY